MLGNRKWEVEEEKTESKSLTIFEIVAY